MNYRKEIKVECTNVSPMPSRRGTIDSEFAISISIFFTVPKAHAFLRGDLRLRKNRPARDLRTRGTVKRAQCALSICASFNVHYPYVSARIHSLSSPPSPAFFPSSFNSLFHPLSPLAPPLNFYAGAYSARFLPVIDAHSIRLRTPVNPLGRCFCP